MSSSGRETMKFDDILVHLGEFGPYQKRIYFILCIPTITGAFHALITLFIVALPEHRCAIPGLDNDTYAVKDAYHRWLINRTVPMKGSDYSKCKIYDIPEGRLEEQKYLPEAANRPNISCHKWIYDKSVFTTTTTEKMGLVCDNLIKRSHLNSIFQGGKMFGSLILGASADIFGRKKVMYWSLVAQLVVGVVTVWIPEYISFCLSRFLLGAFGSGYFLNAFTLGMELVGPSKRMWTGMVIEVFWVAGEFILSGLAFFIRDWQLLQMAVVLPSFIYLTFWCLIPESPRWLMTKGRMADAESILQQAAEVNKVTLPEGAFESEIEDEDHLPKAKLWQLFNNTTLLVRSLVIFLNWCVVSMVYYGLTLNSGYLYGGVHLNFFLSAVVELLAYILCFPLLDRIGRKALHASSMLIGGIACCCTIFTVLYLPEEDQAVTTALALVGKLGASAAFAVIYIFSSELFPTVIRNGGMGISSTSARVGSMASPYIADLGTLIPGSFGTALPLMVFGGASILAGLASLSLPETLNRTLPETIEDAIMFGKRESFENGEILQNKKTQNRDKNTFGTTCSVINTTGYDNPTFALETSV